MTLWPGFDATFLEWVPVLALVYLMLYVARRLTRTLHERQHASRHEQSAP